MRDTFSRIKADLDRLINDGTRLLVAWVVQISPKCLGDHKLSPETVESYKKLNLRESYERWYTESNITIKQVLPLRFKDFCELYEHKDNVKELSVSSFRIADALRGAAITRSGVELIGMPAARVMFESQLDILKAAKTRLESSLFEIKQLLQADLFDSEVDSARELCSKGFCRAAGAVVGVLLEKHLKLVLDMHSLVLKKKNACINDLNQELKNAAVIDVPTWRFIQRLGDLRNLCDHSKGSEPTKEDVEELIAGVDKIMKTVF